VYFCSKYWCIVYIVNLQYLKTYSGYYISVISNGIQNLVISAVYNNVKRIVPSAITKFVQGINYLFNTY